MGISFLVLGLAALALEWSRYQTLTWSWPSQVLLAILSPVFVLMGLRMLLVRGAQAPRGVDAWANPYMVFGLLLGLANAYFLGVWRSVSQEGLLAFAPLLLIVGLVGGVIVVRRRRANAREKAS